MRKEERTLIQGRVTESGVSLTARPKSVRACSDREVIRSYAPRVVLEAALLAAEELRALAVATRRVVAARTGLRRLPGVNKENVVPRSESLAACERLGQIEGPRLLLMALALAHRRSFSNIGQVLEDESCARSQRVNETASGYVEVVSDATPLLARQASQGLASSLSAFRLEGLAQLGEVASCLKESRTEPDEPVRCCQHRVVVQVHAHKPLGIRGHNELFEHNVDIVPPALFVIGERGGFGGLSCKQRALVIADSELEAVAAMQEGQARCPVALPEAENALVVGDGLWLKMPRPTPLGLGRLDGISDAAYSLTSQVQ